MTGVHCYDTCMRQPISYRSLIALMQDLKDQVEKLLMERNELQCRFDCLVQEGGAEVRSEGMGQVIREHFVMENEELKDRNEVRFDFNVCTIHAITGLSLRDVTLLWLSKVHVCLTST